MQLMMHDKNGVHPIHHGFVSNINLSNNISVQLGSIQYGIVGHMYLATHKFNLKKHKKVELCIINKNILAIKFKEWPRVVTYKGIF